MTPLKKNIYIIGACNPYRLLLLKTEDIGYTNKKSHKIRNLVYTINPLPLSLINYIFDFGNLRDEDEKTYIKFFIDTFLNERFSLVNRDNYSNILDKICDSVNFSHTYIRKNNEVSSVSLREIKRFTKFFEFFLNIIKRRKEIEKNYKTYTEKIKYFVQELTENEKKENMQYFSNWNSYPKFKGIHLIIKDFE